MDEKDDTTPFLREPWQRLHEDVSDGPPETTDARIRAAARRDLAPRGGRWWLPASLAASFVLAVFVVQSQFGTLRVPVARESDHGAGGAIEARIIDREAAKQARPLGASPSAPGKRQAEPRDEAEADAYGYLESELAADSAGAGPMVGGPERELKEAMELPQESAAAGEPQAVGEPQVVTNLPTQPPAAAEDNDGNPFEKTPEAWYAHIETLRAQGQAEEADRQLARLEKAHPGWLERYLKDKSGR